MTLRTQNPRTCFHVLAHVLGAMSVLAAPVSAVAAINNLDAAELFVTIWDPVAKASYSKDLGVSVQDFFAYAQSDSGYQAFWRINAGDKAFEQLALLGTASSSLLWAVTAADIFQDATVPYDFNMYTTMRQGAVQGVVSDTYLKLTTQLTAGDVVNGINEFGSKFIADLNGVEIQPYNTGGLAGDFAKNGSIFAPAGKKGYFNTEGAGYPSIAAGVLDGAGGFPGITNQVGKSSWFYKLSSGSFDFSDRTIIDEFDNLKPGAAGDAYWGLAVDPTNGDFVLSYTLESALSSGSAATFAGKARASVTEYRASYGASRSILAPTDEFAGYAGLSLTAAVPEPTGWALSLAGLFGLGWAARKRKV